MEHTRSAYGQSQRESNQHFVSFGQHTSANGYLGYAREPAAISEMKHRGDSGTAVPDYHQRKPGWTRSPATFANPLLLLEEDTIHG